MAIDRCRHRLECESTHTAACGEENKKNLCVILSIIGTYSTKLSVVSQISSLHYRENSQHNTAVYERILHCAVDPVRTVCTQSTAIGDRVGFAFIRLKMCVRVFVLTDRWTDYQLVNSSCIMLRNCSYTQPRLQVGGC